MSGTDLSYKAILGKVLVPLKVQHPLPTIARRCISWAGGTHRGKKRIRIWNKIFFGGNGDGLNLVIVLKGRKFFRVRLRRVLGPEELPRRRASGRVWGSETAAVAAGRPDLGVHVWDEGVEFFPFPKPLFRAARLADTKGCSRLHFLSFQTLFANLGICHQFFERINFTFFQRNFYISTRPFLRLNRRLTGRPLYLSIVTNFRSRKNRTKSGPKPSSSTAQGQQACWLSLTSVTR